MIQMTSSEPLSSYRENSFNLKEHLKNFLQIDGDILEKKLAEGLKEIGDLGRTSFDWENATEFYRDRVKHLYLFDLAHWHLESHAYIGDTIRLLADNARGIVLDFGGGIGTHTIAAALCPGVELVVYCDINPINREFVLYRATQLGLLDKIKIVEEIPANFSFDTIVSFDVLEHLPDPSIQILEFHKVLKPEGKAVFNWCFFKGYNQEHPYHLDDPQKVDMFFRALQTNFVELYHPYFITTRCYRKW